MIELIKKYDRTFVLVLTAVTFFFGYYYTVKSTVKDVNELRPEVKELKSTIIRHDEILKVVVDSQKEMREDIKSILRALR